MKKTETDFAGYVMTPDGVLPPMENGKPVINFFCFNCKKSFTAPPIKRRLPFFAGRPNFGQKCPYCKSKAVSADPNGFFKNVEDGGL